jgi:low affinity Fe/Cu permease
MTLLLGTSTRSLERGLAQLRKATEEPVEAQSTEDDGGRAPNTYPDQANPHQAESLLKLAISRNNLALAYQAAGRADEAIPLLQQTLSDRERLLGPDHPDTLKSRNSLALAYQAAGRADEAIPLLQQTLGDRERLLGAIQVDILREIVDIDPHQAAFKLTQRVSHPDGGMITVEEVLTHETVQRDQIYQETAAGSRKHHRVPRWMRSIPKFVLCLDFGILLYIFSGITNVSWRNPLSLALAFAVVLATMVTLLSYGFLAFTGHRLRSHKNHAGTIHLADVDSSTTVAFILAMVVIAALAVLVYIRIYTALGSQAQGTALVIAVAVGAINAAANVLVIAVHALDGSDQTARLDKLSAAVRKSLDRGQQLRKQVKQQ